MPRFVLIASHGIHRFPRSFRFLCQECKNAIKCFKAMYFWILRDGHDSGFQNPARHSTERHDSNPLTPIRSWARGPKVGVTLKNLPLPVSGAQIFVIFSSAGSSVENLGSSSRLANGVLPPNPQPPNCGTFFAILELRFWLNSKFRLFRYWVAPIKGLWKIAIRLMLCLVSWSNPTSVMQLLTLRYFAPVWTNF